MAVLMWGRSVGTCKFRYRTLVSDGNASSYSAIQAMDGGAGPYGREFPVVKEDITTVTYTLGMLLLIRNIRYP